MSAFLDIAKQSTHSLMHKIMKLKKTTLSNAFLPESYECKMCLAGLLTYLTLRTFPRASAYSGIEECKAVY